MFNQTCTIEQKDLSVHVNLLMVWFAFSHGFDIIITFGLMLSIKPPSWLYVFQPLSEPRVLLFLSKHIMSGFDLLFVARAPRDVVILTRFSKIFCTAGSYFERHSDTTIVSIFDLLMWAWCFSFSLSAQMDGAGSVSPDRKMSSLRHVRTWLAGSGFYCVCLAGSAHLVKLTRLPEYRNLETVFLIKIVHQHLKIRCFFCSEPDLW